jgi:hypothetical protein
VNLPTEYGHTVSGGAPKLLTDLMPSLIIAPASSPT